MAIQNRKLDTAIVALLAIIVGTMLTAPGFYGGLIGKILLVISFIVTVFLGWKTGENVKGIPRVINYLFLWGILLFLQTIGFNFAEGVVATAFSHIIFLFVLGVLWYLIIGRKLRATKEEAQISKL